MFKKRQYAIFSEKFYEKIFYNINVSEFRKEEPMDPMERARITIDEADAELVRIFEKRFAAVRQIVRYKQENGLPVPDEKRERAITEKNVSRVEDVQLRPYFEAWYRQLLCESRRFQQDILDEADQRTASRRPPGNNPVYTGEEQED